MVLGGNNEGESYWIAAGVGIVRCTVWVIAGSWFGLSCRILWEGGNIGFH